MLNILFILSALSANFAGVSAFCEVTWEGIPNSVSHEGRSENGAKFSAEDCCTEALAKPAQDAQSAWNKQSEYFKDAVSQQTSIGVQATEGFASGTLTQSSENSQEYAVEYADRKWNVMANCFCLQEGFLSIDGGCNPRTGANAVVDTVGGIVEAGLQPIEAASNLANEAFEAVGGIFGRKLLQNNNCGDAGRKPDKCTIKVQCNFQAVTSGSCGDDVSSQDFSSDNFNPNNGGFNNPNNGGFNNPNNGGFNNPNNGGFNPNNGGFNNGGIPGFINPAAGCFCEGGCGPLQRTPQFCYNGGTGSCTVNPARCAGQSPRQVYGNYYLCC